MENKGYDEDFLFFENFQKKFKSLLFNVFFVLLKDDDGSKILFFLSSLIILFQLSTFQFSPQVFKLKIIKKLIYC